MGPDIKKMLRKYNLADKTNLADLLCLSKYLKVACKPAFFTSRMIGSYYDHYSYLFITCLVYVTSADKIEASRLNNSNPIRIMARARGGWRNRIIWIFLCLLARMHLV